MTRMHDEETEERRFLIEECTPGAYSDWECAHVTTGFLETNAAKTVRVSIVQHNNDKLPDIYLTVTSGSGVRRRKRSRDITGAAAQLLLDTCAPRITYKTRYRKGNLRVDVYEKDLFGCMVLEVKNVGFGTSVERPPWVLSWREVTGRLTNYELAHHAALRSRYAETLPFSRLLPGGSLPRLVLTGGPCSGKTTVLAALQQRFGDRAQFVSEMATLVMRQLGVDAPPARDPVATLEFQTTIARAQRLFEDGAIRQANRSGKVALICDRGEVDGGAYMDGGIKTLETVSGLTIEHLYERYAKVIYLSVPPREIYDANRGNNETRKEDHDQAVHLGRATRDAWAGHPDLVLIPNYDDMEEKIEVVSSHVAAFLNGLRHGT